MRSLSQLTVAVLLTSTSSIVAACARCRPSVRAQLYGPDFASTLLLLMLPLLILVAVSIAVYFWDAASGQGREGAGRWQSKHGVDP